MENVYLKIIVSAISSVAVLFILTKIMGKRQMSQLSMYDYINGITIGSIAAEMAISTNEEIFKPLTAMIVYALVSTLISVATSKSVMLRRFFVGKSLILYYDGKLYKENFKKSKIDINEFLVSMRNSGYFNLDELYLCVLEPNGQMSFMPNSENKPLMPKDVKIKVQQELYSANVIIDGKVMKETLQNIGKDERWLYKMLSEQNIKEVSEIFLATCDMNGNFNAYIKDVGKLKPDVWV